MERQQSSKLSPPPPHSYSSSETLNPSRNPIATSPLVPSSSASSSTTPEGIVVVGFISSTPGADLCHLANRILDANVFGSGKVDKEFNLAYGDRKHVEEWFRGRKISYHYEKEKGIVYIQFSSSVLSWSGSVDGDVGGYAMALEEMEADDMRGFLFMYLVCNVIIFLHEGSRFDTNLLKKFRLLQEAKNALHPFIRSQISPHVNSKEFNFVSRSDNFPELSSRPSVRSSSFRGSGEFTQPTLFSNPFIFPGMYTPVSLFVFNDEFSGGSLGFPSYTEDIRVAKSSNSVVMLPRPANKTEGSFRKKLQSALDSQIRFLLMKSRTLISSKTVLYYSSDHVDMGVKEKVLSSFPHYGHSGIVECARELFMQIDGTPEIKDGRLSETAGFLSSLMGVGKECHGYKICIAGHSLGGSVATLLGIRLYRHYPNLHVYSYGTLPCVDLIIAEACSSFVTCIVYNDEFAARLSVSSIIRLRTAAITALSDDSTTGSVIMHKNTRQIPQVGNNQQKKKSCSSDILDFDASEVQNKHPCKSNFKHTVKGGRFLCSHAVSCMINMPSKCNCSRQTVGCCVVSSDAAKPDESIQEFCCHESETSSVKNSSVDERKGYNEFNRTDAIENTFEDPRSQCANNFSSLTADNPPEMFLPGLIIHIVQDDNIWSSWKSWRSQDKKRGYSVFVANRELFMDIAVTPYMFLDHLPWRCRYAMQRVIETQKDEHQPTDNSLNV